MEANTRSLMARVLGGGALLCALLASATATAAEVYRWVDENGEVHYSETLPPDHQDRGYDLLNQQGRVVEQDRKLTPEPAPETPPVEEGEELPRDASGLPRPKPAFSEAEKQRRMDNFLLLRYDSEQEILDEMNVEIKQLNYDRRLLEGSQAGTEAAFRDHVRLAADRQRAGLPVEQSTVREIRKNRGELAKIETALDGLQKREDSIRADFQKHLERYRYLIETWTEESSGG